jgi:hypothetical protein
VSDLATVPTEEQAFLWSYSWLMTNYDPESGMVQDRSNFGTGDFENVTATAKAAKNVYYAYKKGYTTLEATETIVTKIADTLINVVPRGPAGVNTLWPRFTRNGGTEVMPPHTDEQGNSFPGSEWASGDTAYAALDIITTLQMLGDPQDQIPNLVDFLQAIDWQELLLEDSGVSHGYSYEGDLLPWSWKGFGMETIGVNWAYASATGNVAVMEPPPSDNGSGFIDNACYPVVFSGSDRWGNDWDAYRSEMADIQIDWYNNLNHFNYLLSQVGLFGLSAGEDPGSETYVAYGVGGRYVGPEDGDSEVIVLHYSGMIADIRLAEAKQVWEVLRDQEASFLEDTIVISPLNNMESMRIDKETGKCTVKHLKGSWNLALQAEGWAQADSEVRNDLEAAIQANTFLKRGYDLLKTPEPPWELVSSPGDVRELASLDGLVFARTPETLFISEDLGLTWEERPIGLTTGSLHPMDIDLGILYVSCRNGLAASEDFGESFYWSFHWTWDGVSDVDLQDGYGWAAVPMWGSQSGPKRKIPESEFWILRRGDIPWAAMSMSWVAVDCLDPFNVAYIGGSYGKFRTLDSGEHWLPCQNRIIFSTLLEGVPVAFGSQEFTEDRGETWQPLGFSAVAFVKDEVTGFLFAAESNGGVFAGIPGEWNPYGLPDQGIQSLIISGDWLLAVSTEGEIFRTIIE